MKMTNNERKRFYLAALEDQRHVLTTAVNAMGNGDLTQALVVATCIRVLVHETGKSAPLLKQLRPSYLDLTIYDSKAPPKRPDGTTTRHLMKLPIGVRISTDDPRISLHTPFDPVPYELRGLGSWWNHASLIFPPVGEMSRRDVILGLANKEGAHVDDDMPAKYRKLIGSNFVQTKINDVEFGPLNLSRIIAGTSGLQLLDCLARHFPKHS